MTFMLTLFASCTCRRSTSGLALYIPCLPRPTQVSFLREEVDKYKKFLQVSTGKWRGTLTVQWQDCRLPDRATAAHRSAGQVVLGSFQEWLLAAVTVPTSVPASVLHCDSPSSRLPPAPAAARLWRRRRSMPTRPTPASGSSTSRRWTGSSSS